MALSGGRSLQDALAGATALLARREHGQKELATKLIAKGFAPALAVRAVERLSCEGLQSDRRFAEALAHRRIERGYGPYYVCDELRQLGVDIGLVDAQLDHSDKYWLRVAMRALEKRFATRGGSYAGRARFLERRGFPTHIVLKALEGDTGVGMP